MSVMSSVGLAKSSSSVHHPAVVSEPVRRFEHRRATEALWSAAGTPSWPDRDRVAASGCLGVTVPARYCGPPGTANGGWVAGTVASMLPAGPAEVTLRAPTPLDVPLHCEWDARRSRLHAPGGGGVLVSAVSVPVHEVPQPPPFVPAALARQATRRFVGHASHPFPGCVVCGPDRADGDGMRIFPGIVDGSPDLVAAPWTVASSLAGPDGRVPPTAIWAALDCATGWAHLKPGVVALLGRLTVSLVGGVVAGRTYVVVAAAQGTAGRKAFASAALYEPDGALVASSRATWVTVA